MSLRCFSLAICAVLLIPLCSFVDADEPEPNENSDSRIIKVEIGEISDDVQNDGILKVTPEGIEFDGELIKAAPDPEEYPGTLLWNFTPNDGEDFTFGFVVGLEFEDVVAKFDVGAFLGVTGDSASITGSELILSWSGIDKTKFVQEAVQALVQEDDETDEEFEERQQQVAQSSEENYIFSNYGGFVGADGFLDILVNDSVITFNIEADAPERAWYIDTYNIHIGKDGATVNIEKGTVAARQIDDVVEDESSGGNLTKVGDGTLIIGGSSNNDGGQGSGLNIGGTLFVTEGTLVLAGDREVAAGDWNPDDGSATTTHWAGNAAIGDGATLKIDAGATFVLTENQEAVRDLSQAKVFIEEGAVLDIGAGATLELTGDTSDGIDIYIGEKGTLRIASEDFYNTEKDTDTFKIMVDGGTVDVYANVTKKALNIELDEKRGVFNVDAKNITFESGAIHGGGHIDYEYLYDGDDNLVETKVHHYAGDYVKIGAGTHVINGVKIVGNFYVTEGTVELNAVEGADFLYGCVQEANKVFITGDGSILDLKEGVKLQLNHKNEDKIDVVIADGGTLKIAAAYETLLFNDNQPGIDDNYPERHDTYLFVDGGTVHFYKGDDFTQPQSGKTIHTLVGSKATIIVDEDVVFEGGTITSEVNGNVVKEGKGTHRIIGDVNIGSGVYTVDGGVVQFTGDVQVGALEVKQGTVEMKMAVDPDEPHEFVFNRFEVAGSYLGGGHDLTVGIKGVVSGTMTDVGKLTIGGTFDLGSGVHDVRTLAISAATTLDLKTGTTLQLTNNSSEYDLEIQGKLRIASAEDTGFFKSNDKNVNLLMDGGTFEVYAPGNATDLSFMLASDVDTTLGNGGGEFIVPEGMTLVSGSITGRADPITKEAGHYWKLGKGTHVINGFDTDGTIQVEAGTIILNGSFDGDDDETQHATSVVVANGATFYITDGVALDMTGSMTIRLGGVVTNNGTIDTKTLDIAGGTLQLQVAPISVGESALATVTTEKLTLGLHARIDVDDDKYQLGLGTHSFENIIKVTGNDGITDAHLKTLGSYQTALSRFDWGKTTTESGDSLNLTVQYLTVNDYMDENNWNQENARAVAGLLDTHVGDRYQEGEEESGAEIAAFAFVAAASTSSVNEIRAELEKLTPSGLDNVLKAAMAGELVGDAARMVMGTPYRAVFQQLDLIPVPKTANKPLFSLGQAKTSSNALRLWLTPYAQSEEGKGDDTTFDGYTLTRVGFLLGSDVNLTKNLVVGMVFNYGSPNVKSDLGKVKANDFMIGAYARVPIYWQITANGMIGYGMQQYTYNGAGGKSEFDGNSLFASLEFTRPFPMMQVLNLTSVVGVDFQSIDMDDLTVTLPAIGSKMPISPDGYDSVMVRVGLRGECMRLRTRVQYMRQVSGDDFVMSSMSLSGSGTRNIRSVQWGKDWLNVGVGGELIQLRNLRLFADYDLDASKNTTSHLGSLSAVMTW